MAKKTVTRGKTKTTKAKTVTKPKTRASAAASKKLSWPTWLKLSTASRRGTASERSLDNILIVSLVAYGLLAAAALWLMRAAHYTVAAGYLGRDALASQTETVFVPAWQPLMDVDLRWIVVALLLLSAVLPVLYLTRLRTAYQQALKDRVVVWRWIDLAVTTAIMMAVVALLSGVGELMTLKLVAGLMVVTSALGWLAEKQNAAARRPIWSAFNISLLTGLLPWLLIATYAVYTFAYGMIRAPWYVYGLYGVTLVGFSLICANQWQQHRRKKQWADYVSVERNYLWLSFATKALFAIVLIVGLQR